MTKLGSILHRGDNGQIHRRSAEVTFRSLLHNAFFSLLTQLLLTRKVRGIVMTEAPKSVE